MKQDYNESEFIFDMLGETDDELLQQALITDSKQKLADLKKKESHGTAKAAVVLKRISLTAACAACLALSIMTAHTLIGLKKPNVDTGSNISSSNAESGDQQSDYSSSENTTSTNHSSSKADDTTSDPSSNSSSHFTEPSSSEHSSQNDSSSLAQSHSSSSDVSSSNNESQAPSGLIIESIDMLNYYSAKETIEETFFAPFSPLDLAYTAAGLSDLGGLTAYGVSTSVGKVYNYAIDRNTNFTVTMVTYFTCTINNENGLLAQKLGGTGTVEVVVTKNSLDNMITFKKGDKYFSCLMNSQSFDAENNTSSMTFSTHKYIDGFGIVKNTDTQNHLFTVHFKGEQVVGIESSMGYIAQNLPTAEADSLELTEDFCCVLFIKRTFTIDQLESLYK